MIVRPSVRPAVRPAVNPVTDRYAGFSWSSYWTNRSFFFLDGTIITVGADKYFKDRSSAARNFLITGYDFDSTWTKGFPYKSAATISAPAGDAVLIAADINNFLYAGDGTPNAIPVVSLFQDIDYEHKIFCKHAAQVVDGNGVETYEPRVLEIYMAQNVEADAVLIKANTYFGVPVEVTTAVRWVSKDGNDATLTASKIAPALTMIRAIALATASDTIYWKTGAYLEDYSVATDYLFIDKSVKIKGIGNLVITCSDATYAIRVNAINVELNVISCLQSVTQQTLSNNVVANLKVEKCYIKTLGGKAARFYGGTVKDSIFIGASHGGEKYNTDEELIVTDSYFYGGTTGGFVATQAGVHKATFNNSKFNGIIGLAAGTAVGVIIVINDCKIYGTSYPLNTGATGSVIVRNSLLEKTGLAVANFMLATGSASGFDFTIDKCILKTILTAPAIFKSVTNLLFTNNKLLSQGATKDVVIQVTTVTIATAYEVSGNIVTTNDDGSAPIYIGNEVNEGYNIMTGVVKNNAIIGPKYYDSSVVVSVHGLPVFNQITTNVSYNRIFGCGIGIVFKSKGTDHTNSDCHHNVIVNSTNGIELKGAKNLKVYNNTVYNDVHSYALYLLDNDVAGEDNDGCVIKNNIFICNTDTATARCILFLGTSSGLTFDYNIYYCKNGKFASVGGTDKTFAEWQALGYDAHSILLSDAQFLALFNNPASYDLSLPALSPAIGVGEDLGATYDDGIDASTDWGADTELPVVVTKQQGAAWDIGAYVH